MYLLAGAGEEVYKGGRGKNQGLLAGHDGVQVVGQGEGSIKNSCKDRKDEDLPLIPSSTWTKTPIN